MLRCCLGAYGRPNHAWMPSLGAGLMRLSQGSISPSDLIDLIASVLFSRGNTTTRSVLQLDSIRCRAPLATIRVQSYRSRSAAPAFVLPPFSHPPFEMAAA